MARNQSDTKSSKTSFKERLWTPVFVFILACSFCAFTGGQGVNTGTTVFLSLEGDSALRAGFLATVFSVTAGVARLACGPTIDRRGPSRVMIMGGIIYIIGMAGPLFSTGEPFFTLWRGLQGVGFSLSSTAAATAAAEVLPESRLGEGIGYFGLGQALAMAVGPGFALYLVYSDPHTNLFVGLTIFTIMVLVFALLCRYENKPGKLPATCAFRKRYDEARLKEKKVAEKGNLTETLHEVEQLNRMSETLSLETGDEQADEKEALETMTLWQRFRNVFEWRALPGFIPMVLVCPAFGFGIFFMGLYGASIGVDNPALFFVLSAITMVLVRLSSGAFMDRALPIAIYTVAILFGVVSFVLILLAGTVYLNTDFTTPLFYIAGLVYGVSNGICLPINQTVAVKNTPPERWGAGNALLLLAPDVANAIAGVLWGLFNDSFGFAFTICCCIGCIIASYICAWIFYPSRDKRRSA